MPAGDRPPGPPVFDPELDDYVTTPTQLAAWDEAPPDPAQLDAPKSPLRFVPRPGNGGGGPATPAPAVSKSLLAAQLEAKVTPEDCAGFAARVSLQPALTWYASQLVPSEGVFLFHGRPRSMKSLNLLGLAFDLAYGRPLWGAERFAVSRPIRVLYLTGEDPERLVLDRLERIQRGVKLPFPPNLQLLVRRGISLDDTHDRTALLSMIEREGIEVAILEPMRSLTSAAESTATEFKPIGDWLRHLQHTTTCKTLGLGAHWRKPSKAQAGGRSESLSGGSLFSFSDCLIAVQKVSWNESVCIPEDYKLGSDPPGFLLRWNTQAESGPSGEPLFGESISPEVVDFDAATARGVDAFRLLDWLKSNPWHTADEIAAGAGLLKTQLGDPRSIYSVLQDLLRQGAVRLAQKEGAKQLGRSSRAKLYALPDAPLVAPSNSPQPHGESLTPHSPYPHGE